MYEKKKLVGLRRGLVQHTFWNFFVLQFRAKKIFEDYCLYHFVNGDYPEQLPIKGRTTNKDQF